MMASMMTIAPITHTSRDAIAIRAKSMSHVITTALTSHRRFGLHK
jgi:hypothetical protein